MANFNEHALEMSIMQLFKEEAVNRSTGKEPMCFLLMI